MNLHRQILLTLALSLFATLAAKAELPQEIVDNPQLTAGNLLAYPVNNPPALSDAPEGYVPFHIEHYGRHGSRWLLSHWDYTVPRDVLSNAHNAGVLTERGERAFATVQRMADDAKSHYGELTALGAAQHRGIANRMYNNFPEIFADSAYVDAKSTVVIRCILSMTNELVEFAKINPRLKITQESTEANQWFLQNSDRDTVAHALRREANPVYFDFVKDRLDMNPFLNKLFTDMDYVKQNINVHDFYNKMFELASNQQSHCYEDELYDLFSLDELYNKWVCNNAGWYLSSGNSPATIGRMPYTQRYLLADFISSAERAIENPGHGASLRFGHETVVLPMVCFMELDDYGIAVDRLEDLAGQWRNYEVFPMASNIQMIFYRNENADDILVKCLLNEREVTLPAGHVEGAYYSWNELKGYYQNKLDAFTTRFEK
ncbi:MAG: histidine acid phosphatase [Muribaculum sp.]|nr:histidine acid phosphatase [Muribaculum sp.]